MTRPRRTLAAVAALATAGAVVPLALSANAAPAARGAKVTVQTLHFDTGVGPNNATHCDVVGDLYTPSTASKTTPAAAILTTNGFGGSKNDQAPQAMTFAQQGDVVLSYSGLGFGGSGCNIELDDPDWDGQAAKQLVDFLGGSKAATNGLKIDYVARDAHASDGKHYANDPRVGMIGGSYGGQVQFAAASVDPRIDAIIPIITWNDLAYSLAPNNTSFTTGVTYKTPGVEKFDWTTAFFGLGIVDGVQAGTLATNKSYLAGCGNFDARACTGKVSMDALGYPLDDTIAFARHASVASFIKKIRIPTLLAQGEGDSLFNLHEAAATYAALRAQHTPVKMVWQSWGHSVSTPAPGEFDGSNLTKTYEGKMFTAWFDYYLRDRGQLPSMDFEYFRPWVTYSGNAAGNAYGKASSYPIKRPTTLYLSGPSDLVSAQSNVKAGTSVFAAAPAGAPTSFSEVSAVGSKLPSQPSPLDAPGTYAAWSTSPLSHDTDVVGVPKVTLSIGSAAPTSSLGPVGMLVVFAKLYDVAPDGSMVLAERLVSPARLDGAAGPVTITLPGIVHRFAKGHLMRLVIAASDAAYRGNGVAQVATVTVGPGLLGALELPVL